MIKLPIKIGELLQLAEADYWYGTGTLTIRVTSVPDQTCDTDWIELRGIPIGWNGDPLPERTVGVRRAALSSRRAPDSGS